MSKPSENNYIKALQSEPKVTVLLGWLLGVYIFWSEKFIFPFWTCTSTSIWWLVEKGSPMTKQNALYTRQDYLYESRDNSLVVIWKSAKVKMIDICVKTNINLLNSFRNKTMKMWISSGVHTNCLRALYLKRYETVVFNVGHLNKWHFERIHYIYIRKTIYWAIIKGFEFQSLRKKKRRKVWVFDAVHYFKMSLENWINETEVENGKKGVNRLCNRCKNIGL